MSNRPQFTVRDLLIWTTALAIGIFLLKLLLDLKVFRSFSGLAESVLFEPAWIVFPFGMAGILVAPAGMLIMLAAMTSKKSRTYSNGLFLLVTTICWVVFFATENPEIKYCFVMLLVMAACSAICFFETYYRNRMKGPDSVFNSNRAYASSIASAIVVVSTKLFWGSALILIQI